MDFNETDEKFSDQVKQADQPASPSQQTSDQMQQSLA